MNRYSIMVAAVLVFSTQAAVVTESVSYQVDGQKFQGYLAFDDRLASPRPGVLVVHEWWGLNDYIRRRAEMLAELGYVALALDMYGDGREAGHPDEAGEFARESLASLPQAERRFNVAHELLADHPLVADSPIAAMGYCLLFNGSSISVLLQCFTSNKNFSWCDSSLCSMSSTQAHTMLRSVQAPTSACPSQWPGALSLIRAGSVPMYMVAPSSRLRVTFTAGSENVSTS
jgi:hypothetical protein